MQEEWRGSHLGRRSGLSDFPIKLGRSKEVFRSGIWRPVYSHGYGRVLGNGAKQYGGCTYHKQWPMAFAITLENGVTAQCNTDQCSCLADVGKLLHHHYL